jgi:hypothetical protein
VWLSSEGNLLEREHINRGASTRSRDYDAAGSDVLANVAGNHQAVTSTACTADTPHRVLDGVLSLLPGYIEIAAVTHIYGKRFTTFDRSFDRAGRLHT